MNKHAVVHVEIPSETLAASAEFYKQVFDWEVQEHPEVDYATWSPGGDMFGGGFTKIDGESVVPGAVLVYISTDDIEASLQKIVDAGGTMVVPMTKITPEFGSFAVFRDPVGNTLALHSME